MHDFSLYAEGLLFTANSMMTGFVWEEEPNRLNDTNWCYVANHVDQDPNKMISFLTCVFRASYWLTCPHGKSLRVQSTRSRHPPGQKQGQPTGSDGKNVLVRLFYQIIQFTKVSDFAFVFGSARKPPIESHSSSATAQESACDKKYWNMNIIKHQALFRVTAS